MRLRDRASLAVELAACRAECAVKGHLWDSERPRGPLGYLPDRCWRCEKTRHLDGYDEAELIWRQRGAAKH